MQEIFSPFKSKQRLWQIFICSLVFIGMAVPFKVMVLIEGFTEVRPVNAVPVVAGLLFGPAGAWGCAIGNLIADLFGTFSKGSILGFVGNFIAAWLPYKLWHISGKRETPNLKSNKNIVKYILIAAVAAIATAILIACGLDMLFDMWIPRMFWIILINDFGFPILFGLPLLIVLTTEDSKIEVTIPEDIAISEAIKAGQGKGPISLKYALLLTLLVSEICLVLMIALGMQMSASPLMYVIGGIFLISLLGFVVKR
jgi:energy-coupling factor transport system substrate-specific component